MKNSLVDKTGTPLKSVNKEDADVAPQKEEEPVDKPLTRNMPRHPGWDAVRVKPALYENSMTLEETADMSDVRNLLPGPNILLVQERELRTLAVRTSTGDGTIFSAKNEGAKGTVTATVIAVSPECKPWIQKNCKPGRNVLIRTMSGNFLSPNGVKHTFVYEQDIIGLCTVDGDSGKIKDNGENEKSD